MIQRKTLESKEGMHVLRIILKCRTKTITFMFKYAKLWM